MAVRLAICLGRLGDPAKGVQLCLQHHREGPDGFPLIRTGQRLARKAKMEWTGSVIPTLAAQQKLPLPYPVRGGLWSTDSGPKRIEEAVIDFLAVSGREAFRSENSLWTTLYGLLFADAIFQPVDGMLPNPYLNRPLDLETPGFRAQRCETIESILRHIGDGGSPELVQKAHARFQGKNIVGVSWGRFTCDQLVQVCEVMDPASLQFIMTRFIDDWRSASKGLPDLFVMPGPAKKTPIHMPASHFLIEVKGPTDTIRDHQRWWIHALQMQSTPSEVWHIQTTGG